MWIDTYSCSATFPQCQNNLSRQQHAEGCPQAYSETQNTVTLFISDGLEK